MLFGKASSLISQVSAEKWGGLWGGNQVRNPSQPPKSYFGPVELSLGQKGCQELWEDQVTERAKCTEHLKPRVKTQIRSGLKKGP